MSQLLLLFACAAFPAIAVPAIHWFVIKPEESATRYTVVCWLWGAFGATVLSFILVGGFSGFLSLIAGSAVGTSVSVTITAPLIEELLKVLPILAIVFLISDSEKRPWLGWLFGITAGLGFAMAENFSGWASASKIVSDQELRSLIVQRLLVITPMHALTSAMIGQALIGRGIATSLIRAIPAYITAVVVHGLVNVVGLGEGSLNDLVRIVIGIVLWMAIGLVFALQVLERDPGSPPPLQ